MLTEKQERFCQEYIIDLNGKQAAIRTGYAERSAEMQASRLISNDKVKARIDELLSERSQRVQITADYVLTTIQETVERCKQTYPVLDRKGEQVYCETPDGSLAPAYTFEAGGVLKGCELLGKHLKLFTEKHEVTGKDGGPLMAILKEIDGSSTDLPDA